MTAAALGLAVVAWAVVVFLLWERHHAADTQALISLVDRMAQRIQAPNAAILEHDELVRELRTEEYAPPAVAPDDDEGYWASRDKLAELLMEQEANGDR